MNLEYLWVLITPHGGTALPAFVTDTLPNALTGIPYYTEIEATGATSFSIVSGSLPSGFTLALVETGLASISGTHDTSETVAFTIQATNAGGSVTLATSIEIEWTFDGASNALVTEGVAPVWYKFNEASGTVINYGSASHDGTASATGIAREQDGQIGIRQAYQMGIVAGSYIAVANPSTMPKDEWTVRFLIKPTDLTAFNYLYNANNLGYIQISSGVGGIQVVLVPSGGTKTTRCSIPPDTQGFWRLFFVTFKLSGDAKVRIYYSTSGTIGEPVSYILQQVATGTFSNSTLVRVLNEIAARTYVGYGDDLMVVNRVLTLEEMQRFQDTAFGTATAETYSVSSLAIDAGFSYAGLNATQKGYYDDMWAAINSPSEYPGGDALVTYSGTYDHENDPENSYVYQIGYGWRYVLWAYAAAFHKTGEQALFDEFARLSDILDDHLNDVEVMGTLYESMYECAAALHMLMFYANRGASATYQTKFELWRDHLLARIAARGGSIIYSALAHSATSAMFTAFALYLVTGTLSYINIARHIRATLQSEVSALSPAGRVVWYHRFPRSAAAGEQYAQATNYADYTIGVLVFLYEFGFRYYNDLAGYDMPRLAGSLLHMTTTGDSCTGDIDGGNAGGTTSEYITPTLYSIRTLAMLAKYDVSSNIATRSLAIKALASSPANLPAVPACLLFGS